MAIRFFHKLEPKNSPVLANGAKCVFSTVNHIDGFFATDNEYIHAEFERLMKEGRYGLNEITAEQFTANYIEKKKALDGRPLRPLWREEVSPRGQSADTEMRRETAAAAVVVSAPPPNVPIAAAVEDVAPPPAVPAPSEFNPPVVKRAKMKPKPKT